MVVSPSLLRRPESTLSTLVRLTFAALSELVRRMLVFSLLSRLTDCGGTVPKLYPNKVEGFRGLNLGPIRGRSKSRSWGFGVSAEI